MQCTVPDRNNLAALLQILHGIVRLATTRLIGRGGFTPADRPDLQQDLTETALGRLHMYDPSRGGLTGFLWVVVRTRAAQLLDARYALCRDCRRRSWSLDEPLPSDGGTQTTRIDLVDADDYRTRLGGDARRGARHLELTHDVRSALDRLPRHLKVVAELLLRMTITEAAAELGYSRATIYDRLRAMQPHFESAGLGAYLGHESTNNRRAPLGNGDGT